jgi:hypothetical protein
MLDSPQNGAIFTQFFRKTGHAVQKLAKHAVISLSSPLFQKLALQTKTIFLYGAETKKPFPHI